TGGTGSRDHGPRVESASPPASRPSSPVERDEALPHLPPDGAHSTPARVSRAPARWPAPPHSPLRRHPPPVDRGRLAARRHGERADRELGRTESREAPGPRGVPSSAG